MNVQDLKKHHNVKTNPQLAKKMGIGRTTVWDWEKKGIPVRTQAALEISSNGELKADRKVFTA